MKNHQNQITILLIESNSEWLTEVNSTLQEAGYNVLTATGGDKGFCAARRAQPDLIICEAALPDISGIQLCYMIRADRNLNAARFILLGDTTCQNCKLAFDSYLAGADDFFDKRCNPRFLATKIGRMLELQHSERHLRRCFEDIHQSQSQLAKLIEDTSNLAVNLNLKSGFSVYENSDSSNSEKRTSNQLQNVTEKFQPEEFVNPFQFEKANRKKVCYEIIS